MKSIILIVAILVASTNAFSETKKIDSDVEHAFSSGSKSTFSKGWSFNEEKNILISPENDLKVHYVETKFESDIEKISLNLWKKVDPSFSFKVYQKASPPASEGYHLTTLIILPPVNIEILTEQ